jgi:soluble lytic murein transglycosylase
MPQGTGDLSSLPDSGGPPDSGEMPGDDAGTPLPQYLTDTTPLADDQDSFPEIGLKYTPLDEKLRLGIDRFRENDFEAATALVSDYLAVNPGTRFRPEAVLVLAISLISTGDSRTAAELLIKNQPPRYLDDYRDYFLAEAFFREAEHQEAFRLFQSLTLNNGTTLKRRASLRMADALYAMNRPLEAFVAYKDYLDSSKIGEMLDTVYLNLARCAMATGDLPAASKYAVKIWYKYPASYMAPKAIEIIDSLHRSDPRLGDPTFKQRFIRGIRLSKSGYLEKAINELTALYDEIPDTQANRPLVEKIYFRLGLLYSQKRDNRTAREIFEGILDGAIFSPETKAKALLELASVEKRIESNNKSIELYLEYVQKYPKSSDADNALYNAAWLRYSMKEYEKATALFERQIKDYPRSDVRDDALWFLAWTYFRNGKVHKAHVMLKILVKDVPESAAAPRAAYFAAKFALREGNEKEARTGFEKVIRDYPLTYYAFMAQYKIKEKWNADLPAAPSMLLRVDPKPAVTASLAAEVTDGGHGTDSGNGSAQKTVDLDGGTASCAQSSGNDGNDQIVDKFVACTRNVLSASKAAALMRIGLNDEAGAELAAIRDSSGNDPEGHFIASTMYAIAGDYYRSISLLRPFFISNMLAKPSSDHAKYWKRMFPLAFKGYVENSSLKNQLDPLLILAISREESTFRPKVVSPVGARGVMQIMPRTGALISRQIKDESFENDDLFDPRKNILYGGWYLHELLVKFAGQVPLAVSAYNAGPGAVTRWLKAKGDSELDEFVEEIPFRETRNYCKRVLQTYGIYRHLYLGADTPLPLFTRLIQEYKENIDF